MPSVSWNLHEYEIVKQKNGDFVVIIPFKDKTAKRVLKKLTEDKEATFTMHDAPKAIYVYNPGEQP